MLYQDRALSCTDPAAHVQVEELRDPSLALRPLGAFTAHIMESQRLFSLDVCTTFELLRSTEALARDWGVFGITRRSKSLLLH